MVFNVILVVFVNHLEYFLWFTDCLTIGVKLITYPWNHGRTNDWSFYFFNNNSNLPRMCVLSPLCGNVDKHSPFDIYIYICFVLLQQSRVASGRLPPPPSVIIRASLNDEPSYRKIPQTINTLRPGQDGRHFPDYIFKRIFFNENVWIFTKISLKFVLKGPIYIIPALVMIMAWRRPGDKPLSEPMMACLLTQMRHSASMS